MEKTKEFPMCKEQSRRRTLKGHARSSVRKIKGALFQTKGKKALSTGDLGLSPASRDMKQGGSKHAGVTGSGGDKAKNKAPKGPLSQRAMAGGD